MSNTYKGLVDLRTKKIFGTNQTSAFFFSHGSGISPGMHETTPSTNESTWPLQCSLIHSRYSIKRLFHSACTKRCTCSQRFWVEMKKESLHRVLREPTERSLSASVKHCQTCVLGSPSWPWQWEDLPETLGSAGRCTVGSLSCTDPAKSWVALKHNDCQVKFNLCLHLIKTEWLHSRVMTCAWTFSNWLQRKIQTIINYNNPAVATAGLL